MAYWLIPVCLFALFASILLGGTAIEPKGGSGLRQTLGLLASAAVHVAIWNLLRIVLASILSGDMSPIVLASLLSIPAVYLASLIGFIIFGVKLGKAAEVH